VERSSALGEKRSEPLGSLDCQRELSKNLAGPSETEQGTGIASMASTWRARLVHPSLRTVTLS